MKHLRKFDSVSAMEAAITASEITVVGMAFDGTTPVLARKSTATPPAPVVDPTVPFYIEDVSGSENTVQIKKNNDNNAPTLTIEKSTDGTTWHTMGETSTTAITATVPANGKLYLRCNTTTWYKQIPLVGIGYNYIVTTGDFNVGGNIMSLLYGGDFTGNEASFPSGSIYTFCQLFNSNTNLVNASDLLLPATTLASSCYSQMFQGCTSLTKAPVLPATTLASSCYNQMFQGCTSLTAAPELPATTLASNCYRYMFQDCTSLTTAPALPAIILTQSCYQFMFNGCTSLTKAPVLPATTLASSCYSQMFQGCTSLTTVPELVDATLADYCYVYMFYGCTNLNYIKCLVTDTSVANKTTNWLSGVSATGTFVKDPNMSYWTTGNNGIPSGWTVEDATA